MNRKSASMKMRFVPKRSPEPAGDRDEHGQAEQVAGDDPLHLRRAWRGAPGRGRGWRR